MNFGIYIPDMGNSAVVSQCVSVLEKGTSSGIIKNASIFFDNMGPINEHLSFGIFNATDIWNFNGTLFALTPDCAIKASNTVNNIHMCFGFGWENQTNLFAILDLVHNKKLKAIAKTELLSKEFYRITGHEAAIASENLENILELMVTK